MFKIAFSFFSNINQSACSTVDWVLNIQSDFASLGISNMIEDNTNVNIHIAFA